ncbi:HlyU family transcriptional regulator [Frigidibacter sp. ROC022]|uniref:HlyU family transcriptional regulator n=1 Tax=Frigidibacter sp. ROC022 TaxID=2971796 RepID=UPI00215A7E2E|nr:HlyU family transcriptional regulator [Frigidibacter sp. ROC022]MCR8725434.1 HlyU family transcriptional regulator [Frigidibacter sp. ROC022]
MSILSRLFGGGSARKSAPDPETYNGFTITPTPVREGSRFRLSARIEAQVGEETRTHTLIRADMLDSEEAAVEASLRKARQVIDEQGQALFD